MLGLLTVHEVSTHMQLDFNSLIKVKGLDLFCKEAFYHFHFL